MVFRKKADSTQPISLELRRAVVDYIAAHYIPTEPMVGFSAPPAPKAQKSSRKTIAPMAEMYECAMPMAAVPNLEDLLRQADAGFSETLLELIDRTGKKDPEIYKKANVDRKLFSKIRNDPHYTPSKSTALSFAIALELNLQDTDMLLSRAGYALSHSSKADIIIEYFIEKGCYDIHTINQTLYEFDQKLLGI